MSTETHSTNDEFSDMTPEELAERIVEKGLAEDFLRPFRERGVIPDE